MLSGMEIINQIENGNIAIEPFDKKNIGPNSYYIHMANELIVYDEDVLECKKQNKTRKIIIPEEGYVIKPGELYLGRTVEYTKTDHYVPILSGCLSIASMGVSIHNTAGFGDNGYKGIWTLGISCIRPVRIYPNMKIGHISYFPIVGDDKIKYEGKYLGQEAPTASQIYKDF